VPEKVSGPEKEEPTDSIDPKDEPKVKEDVDTVSTDVREEPVVDEKPPKKRKKQKEKTPRKRVKLTVLQAAVLETIRERPQRPQAIQTIIRGVGGIEIPRNEIIRSLNELRKKGLVEKISTKAWQAK
jgi:hypothetical protein